MKVNVIFDLSDETDRYEFNTFVHQNELMDIKEQLYTLQRNYRKYDPRESLPTDEVVESLREIIALYTGDE